MLTRPRLVLCLLLPLLLSACGGGGSGSGLSSSKTNTSAVISGDNVAPLVVDAGPSGLAQGQYTVNEVFTSVTICDSEIADNCQTIDHILVDTGSSGLRIIASVISPALNLPPKTDANGKSIGECGMFADGYTWGPIKTATIKLANQTALSVPIQVIGDPGFATVPTACANTGVSENTVASFGANGVLGVGYFVQDCGSYCANNSPGIYYTCTTSACSATSLALADQVTNPVSKFDANSNNGVMLSLPALDASGDLNVTGSLVFGINTQSNNQLGAAQIYTVAASTGYLTTIYNGQTLPNSFIDSGSNGLYFDNSAITTCSNAPGFYCPGATLNESASIQDTVGNQVTINFNVANAASLFATSNTAFDDLAGSGVTNGFDWGLPFFYGRKVFVVFEGQFAGGGSGPFIAF